MKTKDLIIAKIFVCLGAVIFLLSTGATIEANHVDQTTQEPTIAEHYVQPVIHISTVAPQFVLSEEEIDLIAIITMAEAEGESVLGKRLVIDTILNRIDDAGFPNTVNDVVYQPNAFESLWNGRIDRCHVRDDICELVLEEAASRTNTDVVYFCAGNYSDYGTPLFQEGNHCFSGI